MRDTETNYTWLANLAKLATEHYHAGDSAALATVLRRLRSMADACGSGNDLTSYETTVCRCLLLYGSLRLDAGDFSTCRSASIDACRILDRKRQRLEHAGEQARPDSLAWLAVLKLEADMSWLMLPEDEVQPLASPDVAQRMGKVLRALEIGLSRNRDMDPERRRNIEVQQLDCLSSLLRLALRDDMHLHEQLCAEYRHQLEPALRDEGNPFHWEMFIARSHLQGSLDPQQFTRLDRVRRSAYMACYPEFVDERHYRQSADLERRRFFSAPALLVPLRCIEHDVQQVVNVDVGHERGLHLAPNRLQQGL
ncbi:MAG: hypothetical protein R3F46_07360 [bacterium]